MKNQKPTYYYCEDTGEYIKEDVFFYSIQNGKLVKDDYYTPILIGDIWVTEITEEEFNKHLKSKE